MTNEDDVRIGGNLRRIRKSLGVSQEKLGEMLGITFQQVQKYENATNRISMSAGLKICRGLGIQITDLTLLTLKYDWSRSRQDFQTGSQNQGGA